MPWKQKIRDYYIDNFPSDTLGEQLNPEATFEDLFNCLDAHQDVYELFWIGDSLIRERLFEALAGIIDMPYDYVYEQWLQTC